MKKIFLTLLAVTVLAACGSQYVPDRSYMTPEQIELAQQDLEDALQKYETVKDSTSTDPADEVSKIDATASVGLRYMNLGDYDNAITFYEEVIELDPTHFPALNNLAVMYEEMGELDKAIEYVGELYNLYTDNAEVNSDFIRLLLANKQFEEAVRVVEAYKLTEKAIGNEEFIKSLEESIEKAKAKG